MDVMKHILEYKNVIILGDFNSQNTLWGSTHNDANSVKILKYMELNDLIISNNKEYIIFKKGIPAY